MRQLLDQSQLQNVLQLAHRIIHLSRDITDRKLAAEKINGVCWFISCERFGKEPASWGNIRQQRERNSVSDQILVMTLLLTGMLCSGYTSGKDIAPLPYP
jgi:hypothetical protein